MLSFIKKSIQKKYIIYKRGYAPRGADLFHDLNKFKTLETFRIIFDVGANIGQTALDYHKNFYDGLIYSFEPVKTTYSELLKNVQKLERVESINMGFADFEKKVTIMLEKESVINSLHNVVEKIEKSDELYDEIQISTIEDFCIKRNIGNIDLLKSDTEGFDLNVLKGAGSFLVDGKIEFILVEACLNRDFQNSSFIDLYHYLYGFRYYFVGFYNQTLHRHSKELNYFNALFKFGH